MLPFTTLTEPGLNPPGDEQTNRTQMPAGSKCWGAVDSYWLLSLLHSKDRKPLRAVLLAQRIPLQRGAGCGNHNRSPWQPLLSPTLSHNCVALGYHHQTSKAALILLAILQPPSHCDVSTGATCWMFAGCWPDANAWFWQVLWKTGPCRGDFFSWPVKRKDFFLWAHVSFYINWLRAKAINAYIWKVLMVD